jgi:hypothetical protein
MNYDIAPADELNQAEALANSIDSQIDSLSNVTSEDAVIIMSSSSPASQIASIIADSGIVVSLILARNRLSAITVRAENAGQQ